MALTKEQWFSKLKSWVPSWYFNDPNYQEAVFYAIAKILSDAQIEAENLKQETFISEASGSYLDLHGDERSVTRITGELDPSYSVRIRNFQNKSNRPSLKALVDALLINGESQITEDYESQLFLDREVFASRGQVFTENIHDAFTVIIENQKHAPYSFLDRECFMDRENFVGTLEAPNELFEAIIAAIDRAKAFGVLYRVYERAEV